MILRANIHPVRSQSAFSAFCTPADCEESHVVCKIYEQSYVFAEEEISQICSTIEVSPESTTCKGMGCITSSLQVYREFESFGLSPSLPCRKLSTIQDGYLFLEFISSRHTSIRRISICIAKHFVGQAQMTFTEVSVHV